VRKVKHNNFDLKIIILINKAKDKIYRHTYDKQIKKTKKLGEFISSINSDIDKAIAKYKYDYNVINSDSIEIVLNDKAYYIILGNWCNEWFFSSRIYDNWYPRLNYTKYPKDIFYHGYHVKSAYPYIKETCKIIKKWESAEDNRNEHIYNGVKYK